MLQLLLLLLQLLLLLGLKLLPALLCLHHLQLEGLMHRLRVLLVKLPCLLLWRLLVLLHDLVR